MSVFTTISIQPPPFLFYVHFIISIYYLLIVLFSSFESHKTIDCFMYLQLFHTWFSFFVPHFPLPSLSLLPSHLSPPPSPFLLLLFSLSLPLIGILILPSNLRLKSGEFCLGLTPTGCSIFTVAPLLLALTQVRFNLLNNCML